MVFFILKQFFWYGQNYLFNLLKIIFSRIKTDQFKYVIYFILNCVTKDNFALRVISRKSVVVFDVILA